MRRRGQPQEYADAEDALREEPDGQPGVSRVEWTLHGQPNSMKKGSEPRRAGKRLDHRTISGRGCEGRAIRLMQAPSVDWSLSIAIPAAVADPAALIARVNDCASAAPLHDGTGAASAASAC